MKNSFESYFWITTMKKAYRGSSLFYILLNKRVWQKGKNRNIFEMGRSMCVCVFFPVSKAVGIVVYILNWPPTNQIRQNSIYSMERMKTSSDFLQLFGSIVYTLIPSQEGDFLMRRERSSSSSTTVMEPKVGNF